MAGSESVLSKLSRHLAPHLSRSLGYGGRVSIPYAWHESATIPPSLHMTVGPGQQHMSLQDLMAYINDEEEDHYWGSSSNGRSSVNAARPPASTAEAAAAATVLRGAAPTTKKGNRDALGSLGTFRYERKLSPEDWPDFPGHHLGEFAPAPGGLRIDGGYGDGKRAHSGSTDRGKAHKAYRVLCLDGGGVRGMLTVSMLQRLHRHNPRFLDNVDAIVGTSAGGILALLLASGYDPDELESIYEFSIPHIFKHDPYRVINPYRARYDDTAKEQMFKYFFGADKTMQELKKPCTVVAFRLDGRKSKTHNFFNKEGWRPAILSNLPAAESSPKIEPDSNLYTWEAAMRTSAAPTFFPVYQGYTDGGIVANNPSILALSKAMAHFRKLNTRNTVLLSLGSGHFPRHTDIFSSANSSEVHRGSSGNLRIGKADWGIKQWIPFLLDILMDGDSITSEMVMQYLLGAHGMYHRCDPRLSRQIALDDVTSTRELHAFGEEVDMEATFRFVDKFFVDDIDDTRRFGHGGFNQTESSTNYHDAWVHHYSQNAQRR